MKIVLKILQDISYFKRARPSIRPGEIKKTENSSDDDDIESKDIEVSNGSLLWWRYTID